MYLKVRLAFYNEAQQLLNIVLNIFIYILSTIIYAYESILPVSFVSLKEY